MPSKHSGSREPRRCGRTFLGASSSERWCAPNSITKAVAACWLAYMLRFLGSTTFQLPLSRRGVTPGNARNKRHIVLCTFQNFVRVRFVSFLVKVWMWSRVSFHSLSLHLRKFWSSPSPEERSFLDVLDLFYLAVEERGRNEQSMSQVATNCR